MDWIKFTYYSTWLLFSLLILLVCLFAKFKTIGKKIAVGILIGVNLIFIYAGFVEPKLLFVHNSEISLREHPAGKIKAAVISDFHIGVFKNGVSLKKIVEKTNSLNPDIVFLAGDFVYRLDKNKIEESLSELKNLSAPAFAVTGNHDAGKPGKNVNKEIKAALKKFGIHAIDDKIENINIKQSSFAIAGLSDAWTGDADYTVLEKINAGELAIVLTHNPDIVYSLSENSKIDLLISGHTHGGQIRLPLLYKFAIPSEYDFDRGFYKINGVNVFVSSGIGMVGLPFRFLVPPVIDVLEIKL